MLYRRAFLAGVVAASFALGALTAPDPAAAQPEIGLAAPLRQLDHAEHRIRVLEHRRAYLHRYIRHLRAELHAPVAPATTTSSTSSTSTTSAPSYSGGVLSDAQVTSYLLAAGFPSSAVPQMLYYSHRESGNDPNAINASSGACGLFQLYPCSGGSAWLNPATNARLAYQKYAASGFAPWGG